MMSHRRAGVKLWQLSVKSMGNSKHVLRRFISLLCRKTDSLHALVMLYLKRCCIREFDGCIGIQSVVLIDWKAPMVQLMMSPIYTCTIMLILWKTAKTFLGMHYLLMSSHLSHCTKHEYCMEKRWLTTSQVYS